MQHLDNKEHLFVLLAEGLTVLTPNNRLSESILQQYFIHSQNKTVDKPFCMPFNVAISKAYEQLHFHSSLVHPTLLNSAQCQHVWQKIIKSHPDITYSDGLLQSVISAWERCQQWQIQSDEATFHYTTQTQQFQQWCQNFEAQLNQKQLMTECQLIPYLIQKNSLLFSQPVVWVCFDDFNPQQKELQAHLAKNGLTQYLYDLTDSPTIPQVLKAPNDKEEYQQLIAWLQQQLQHNRSRIGVVVPELQQKSQAIQRILTSHFNPALFNISLGQPLSQFPLVAHALSMLHQDTKYLTPHQASLLLQSPYLSGAQEEFLARSEYLQEASLLEDHMIPLPVFIRDIQATAPKLAGLLSQMVFYPQEASINEWIHLFQERLNSLGFPGDYGLNSENYQCIHRFNLLFDELRQLSLLSRRLNKGEALAALHQLADNIIFQAKKTNTPIQICGLLEASGCEFDSLWVMGLTDQCLPQKVHLSAFIPPHLQRDLLMPHSLPARELQFAKQILRRLQHSADEVVFSYAQLQGDNPNLPCSLLSEFPSFQPLLIHHQFIQTDLTPMEDSYTIPISTEESISGGTAILANQAKCPFKAFAEHRLRAKASSQTTEGLDAKERGKIIHRVMELLWKALGDQHQLFDLAEKALEAQIDQAIHTALARLKEHHPESFPPTAQEVEYIRLKRLVHDSLAWEKQRSPFTIAGLEQSYTINLAGLDFQVRVDRIDQVADKKWIIDYKSSLPNSKPWNEDRPKEPQLLLYALLDNQINALLLMQLKRGKISCSGFSEEKQGIIGMSSVKKEETWEENRSHWQEQLTVLAEEFKQGYCPPQPVQTSLCQQCDYQSLCRFQAND